MQCWRRSNAAYVDLQEIKQGRGEMELQGNWIKGGPLLFPKEFDIYAVEGFFAGDGEVFLANITGWAVVTSHPLCICRLSSLSQDRIEQFHG